MPPADPSSTPQIPSSRAASRERILVVDDEESIRHVLIRILGGHYQVDAVSNGRVALEKVAATRYDLIICDLYMPGMGGLDFYERWRAQWPRQAENVPIVFITGDMLSSYIQEQLARIDAPYLHKPFDLDDLLDLVGSLLKAD